MARIEYGQTWWGKQWLGALTAVDWDNRLPRGKTYANNGSVRHFEIGENQISAKVQGSSMYRISIKIPPFTTAQKKELLDRVAADPAIISGLLNRVLDPQILKIAESCGIQVFPRRWDDFSMNCSCPDWAVPCKHLAAVVFVVSREIDKNPFVVFNLHGLDLLTELGRRGVKVEKQAKISIAKTNDLLVAESAESAKEFVFDRENYDSLDFTAIESLLEQLPRLLSPKPLFYERGDFRELYIKALKSAAKEVSRYFSRLDEMAEAKRGQEDEPKKSGHGNYRRFPAIIPPVIKAQDTVKITLDKNLQIAALNAGNCQNLDELIDVLGRIEEKDLFDYHDSVIALRTICFFALNLVKHGGVLPQLVETGEKTFLVRWLPATINESVRTVFKQIHSLMPPVILFFQNQSEKNRSKETPIGGENQTMALCALFLTHFIKKWNGILSDWKYAAKLEKAGEMFFDAKPHRFAGPEESSVPETVQLWLNRFSLPHKNFVPALRVRDFEETGNAFFGVDALVENKKEPLSVPIELSKFLSAPKFQPVKFDVLRDLSLLAEYFPELGDLVRAEGKQPLFFDSDRFAALFFEILPVMRLFGINLILPKSLKHLVRPQISMKMKKKAGETSAAFLRLDDLLTFDWQIALGNENLTPAEFAKLVKNLSGIVNLKGQYVYLNAEELDKLQNNLLKEEKISTGDLLQAALSEEYRGAAVSLSDELRRTIKDLTESPAILLPENLYAEMRPYQLRGFEWLYKNTMLGFGSLMADDMGLGKTLQVIAALLKFKEENRLEKEKALVIVPTSLLTNWRKEIEKFAPSLVVGIYHGSTRDFQPEKYDITLTSYGIIRSDLDKFKKAKWFAVVVDEAQNIKNTATAQTKAVKSLKARTFIAMSGTPVENRLSEYWSIMDFVNRGYLGSLKKFHENFAKPIQNEKDHNALERFKKTTAPFLLRRLKSDKSIISDLPDKIENDQLCSLTKEQAAVYENTVKAALKTIEGAKENFARQGLVLQMILALKQICNHPAQYLKKGSDAPELSGKAVLMLSLLENILEAGEKTLIFTQYREMGDLLVKFIEQKFGAETLFLHGGVSRKRRDEMVETFQNERACKIFILSLKAGGTGLNLTAASNVIHYDLWWNPAVEAQATDRAYRIGQQKNVMVYRLITGNTFEERINDMIRSKRELADLTVGTGENWIGNLPNKDLRDIFELQHDR
ncbi:MAG: DEAD/DEAH box helicase [Acidobacteriota bacterium]|nr:DEAD/DEAH box helicase [Acidobacteriota bacterium]